jgi:hypothetical protein
MYDFNKPDVAEAILKAKGVEFQILCPFSSAKRKKSTALDLKFAMS